MAAPTGTIQPGRRPFCVLDFGLFGHLQDIIDLNEVADRALQHRVSE
jgi:hypothetical protein